MTILNKPPRSGTGHAEKHWYKLGAADQPVRRTDATEHETFAEEQARWERADPAYARICEQVRDARNNGEEASQRADQAKAEWDARAATRRQANDDAHKARHALKADQTARRRTGSSRTVSSRATEAPFQIERCDAERGDPRTETFPTHPTFPIESHDSPAPGIIPEPVRVHDQSIAPTHRSGGYWHREGRGDADAV